jgi:DNA polymerase III subunit gamma/tau
MSWDTKYRPLRYEDVLGQGATVRILRQIVKTGRGFHQSYLFTGAYGMGKTTLGRILARALLCKEPVDGGPCNKCRSCEELIRTGNSECFTEIDAATNSGKEGIRKILAKLDYRTFTGGQRIYLFDESHQLSRDALDALLKPLEDTLGASENRKLVCIFCTTEPEKMRATIGSRCGPTFTIREVPTEKIAERLAWVCDQEGAQYEMEALHRVSEGVEGHIRNALKACEMLSLQGGVTAENVRVYLGHDLNNLYLDLLEGLRGELAASLEALKALFTRVSPAVIYEKLARVCLLAYKRSLGIGRVPSYWEDERLQKLGSGYGDTLLDLSDLFSFRPRNPTTDMVQCDLLSVHRRLQRGTSLGCANLEPLAASGSAPAPVLSQPESSRVQGASLRVPLLSPSPAHVSEPMAEIPSDLPATPEAGSNYLTANGVYVPPWGMSSNRIEALKGLQGGGRKPAEEESGVDFSSITPQSFSLLVRLRAQELVKGSMSNMRPDSFCSFVCAISREMAERLVVQGGSESERQSQEADS